MLVKYAGINFSRPPQLFILTSLVVTIAVHWLFVFFQCTRITKQNVKTLTLDTRLAHTLCLTALCTYLAMDSTYTFCFMAFAQSVVDGYALLCLLLLTRNFLQRLQQSSSIIDLSFQHILHAPIFPQRVQECTMAVQSYFWLRPVLSLLYSCALCYGSNAAKVLGLVLYLCGFLVMVYAFVTFLWFCK